MAEEQKTKPASNKVTIEDVGPCKKKVTIEIPEKAIKTAKDGQYESLRKDAIVPGFRKGRAPRRLLEKRFGKETSEQIKLKLLADASDSAVKDNELDILRDPDIDYEKIELPETGPMKVEFEVEVRPEFELPELEGIKVEKTVYGVSDEDVDNEIEQLKKWSGVWTPREEGSAVEANDQIIADAILKVEGVDEEEKLDNTNIYVRPNGTVGQIPVENLDELLAGTKAGESRESTVEIPKTYFKEEYRGKKIAVKITVNDIKWLKPAELNKGLFERFGVEDEKELREKIADSLKGRLEQQAQSDMSQQIYQYMLDNIDFDLPTDVVADQATGLLQRQYTSLLQQGLPPERLEEQMEQLRASSEEQAKEQMKTYFIMDKVADKLGIEVTEEEINGHIARLAIQRGQRPEKMREAMMRDGSLGQFKLQIREDKCISKILETAKITEVKSEKEDKKAKKTKETKKAVKKTTSKTASKITPKAESKEKKKPKTVKKTAKKETKE